jgi:glutathione peroxidase
MSNFHDFSLKSLTDGELNLTDYKNKAVLVVNVASKCGLTPQYEKLEPLYRKYKDQGFIILGIPCNQFMGQEPGSDEEIQSFCRTKYDVTFPLSSKVDVNGETRDPLYNFLAGEQATFPGDIQWNFEKFLIGKDGEVIKRFSPKVEPDDAELVNSLETALK